MLLVNQAVCLYRDLSLSIPISSLHQPAILHTNTHAHTHTYNMPRFLPNALTTLEKYMVVIIASRQSSRQQDAHDIPISGSELTDDRHRIVTYPR